MAERIKSDTGEQNKCNSKLRPFLAEYIHVQPGVVPFFPRHQSQFVDDLDRGQGIREDTCRIKHIGAVRTGSRRVMSTWTPRTWLATRQQFVRT